MAKLIVYNEEKQIELISDNNKTIDSFCFDGNVGLPIEQHLFLLVKENFNAKWRSIHIEYDMEKSIFKINDDEYEDSFEIELNDDEDIIKYFTIDAEEIVDFKDLIN